MSSWQIDRARKNYTKSTLSFHSHKNSGGGDVIMCLCPHCHRSIAMLDHELHWVSDRSHLEMGPWVLVIPSEPLFNIRGLKYPFLWFICKSAFHRP